MRWKPATERRGFQLVDKSFRFGTANSFAGSKTVFFQQSHYIIGQKSGLKGAVMETMTGNVVLLVFLVIQIIVGAILLRSKKPYKAVLLVVHIIISLFILLGFASGIYVYLAGIVAGKMLATISLYAAGAALLLNLITGVSLLTLKNVNPKLVSVHKITAFFTADLLIAHMIFLAVKI
jgi:hypothetical protein